MEQRQQTSQKRIHPRYQAQDRALAMVSSSTNMPYHIIDISKGGMAFRYLGEKMPDDNISALDLYYNDMLCVKDVPVKKVADCWTGSELTDIRRSCLSFSGLTTEQQKQVDLFIQSYTIGQSQ